MTPTMLGVTILIGMLVLMFLRVPISVSMGIAGIVGTLMLKDLRTLCFAAESIVWSHCTSYSLVTIPMFVLMGELLAATGISSELFQTFKVWFSRLRGGLAMASIGASAIFAAASGSSIATTGTIGTITYKEMLKEGYDPVLIGGSITSGGSLGFLIPPSTMFIIYGMIAEQSIGQLLIAGIIPGFILAAMLLLTVALTVHIKPEYAPQTGEGHSWWERILALRYTGWVVALFVLVIGGMYAGWFSPTEAAGIGAAGASIIIILRRKLTFRVLKLAMTRTLHTTAFLFAIIIAAFIFNYFLALTKLPGSLATALGEIGLPNLVVFLMIMGVYLVLGAIMDSFAMVVITVPIILPIMENMGFSPIWFGVVVVLCVQLGYLSPPVGMNCYVLKGVAPELDLGDIFKGAIVFMFPLALLILTLYFFPNLALFLPNQMFS